MRAVQPFCSSATESFLRPSSVSAVAAMWLALRPASASWSAWTTQTNHFLYCLLLDVTPEPAAARAWEVRAACMQTHADKPAAGRHGDVRIACMPAHAGEQGARSMQNPPTWLPCSMKRSGSVMGRSFSPPSSRPSSAKLCITARKPQAPQQASPSVPQGAACCNHHSWHSSEVQHVRMLLCLSRSGFARGQRRQGR